MRRPVVVTIDGPAGSGKSSVARGLAERLDFGFVSSGAIYRAVAWRVRGGLSLADTLGGMQVEFRGVPTVQRVWVDGNDVTAALTNREVSELASTLSQRPEVRAFADELQRRLAGEGPVVVEGRDAGTVVFPEADCKFFLDASLPARAERRLAESRARGEAVDLHDVRQALAERDEADRGRALAPLARAVDATYIDSSGMTVDEVVKLMVKEVERVCSTP